MNDLVEIDGSKGEGGGQILRSSLTLSMLTGRPVRIVSIRNRRSRGGLRAQHLLAVNASVEISGGRAEGAQLDSRELLFEPGSIRPGKYRFEVGTAGSTSLVLQTIALPLALSPGRSQVIITGGTHVPGAPCFHYLERQWCHLLALMGINIRLEMKAAGYYPRGGGELHSWLESQGPLRPIRLTQRGELKGVTGISAVSNLDSNIAERQARRARKRLADFDLDPDILVTQFPSVGPGTFILLLGEFEGGRCSYFGLGEIRKKAERVAEEATRGMAAFLNSSATVDEYAADQLLLPAAITDGTSEYLTPVVTRHLLTNADVVRQFVGAEVNIDGAEGEPGRVTVTGSPV